MGLSGDYMPFPRIGTVETSDENKTVSNVVKDKFVIKSRVRTFWNFKVSTFGFQQIISRKLRKRPF